MYLGIMWQLQVSNLDFSGRQISLNWFSQMIMTRKLNYEYKDSLPLLSQLVDYFFSETNSRIII